MKNVIEVNSKGLLYLMNMHTDGDIVELNTPYIEIWNLLKDDNFQSDDTITLSSVAKNHSEELSDFLKFLAVELLDGNLDLNETFLSNAQKLIDQNHDVSDGAYRVIENEQDDVLLSAYAQIPRTIESGGTDAYGNPEPCGVEETCE